MRKPFSENNLVKWNQLMESQIILCIQKAVIHGNINPITYSHGKLARLSLFIEGLRLYSAEADVHSSYIDL